MKLKKQSNKLFRAFAYAGNGIRYSSINEVNFRIHLFSTFTVIVAGFCFNISGSEWLAVITCCMLVMAAEMFNTAIEAFCNCISPGTLPAIKIVKDVAAGAVLVTAIGSGIMGLLIFIPKIINAVNTSLS
jgi:diacylglycerol kinase